MALVITVQDRVIVRTLSRWSWVISTVWLNCELQTPLATNFYFTERDTMIWQKNISNFLKSSENKIGLWYDTSANRFDWISDWKYQIRHFYFFNNLNQFFAWCNYQNMLVLLQWIDIYWYLEIIKTLFLAIWIRKRIFSLFCLRQLSKSV